MNLTDAQASDLLLDLSIDAIRRSPDVYIKSTGLLSIDLIRGERETVARHVDDRRSAWKGMELTSP